MKCSDATELLDRMIFEEVPINNDLRQHIDTCPGCSQLYSEALKAREIMALARRMEPVLHDPGKLTENIMTAIGVQSPKTASVPLFFQRLLAAASVALFLLFGYEQSGVVRKVSALEVQFSRIKAGSSYPGPQQLASTIYIQNAGISFSEIEKFLYPGKGFNPMSSSNIQKRLHKRNIK
jgi:hypothetical protein